MKKNFIIFVLLFFSSSFAISEDIKSINNKTQYEVPYGQSVICEEELSIGFNWKNRKFVRTTYKNKKIIFKKINHNFDKSNRICKFLMEKEKDWVVKDYARLKRCYTSQNFGKKASPSICDEDYEGEKLVGITCGIHKFDPDGIFIRRPYYSVTVKSDDDYKDSFSISHGKCARF